MIHEDRCDFRHSFLFLRNPTTAFVMENMNLKSLFLYFIYPQKGWGKNNLKQYNIKLDAAYNIKYIWLAMRKVAEAAKCLLTLILWVTADV